MTAKNYAEKYKSEQEQYLERLKRELRKFKDDYGASMTEMAEGLGISRQKLYNFIGKPKESIAIDRSNVLGLWDKLTDSEEFRGLTKEQEQKRRQLRQAGPDSLLKIAGFLPQNTSESLDDPISMTEHPQIRRVVSRLSSRWIEDDVLRSFITDSILDQILDRGRLNKSYYINPVSDPEMWAKNELESKQPGKIESDALDGYQREIRRLASSGKTQFVGSELFELYQSILEHKIVNANTERGFSVTDCQFQTLSLSISQYDEEMASICQSAEERLVNLLCKAKGSLSNTKNNEKIQRGIEFTLSLAPVIEVSISCDFYIGNEVRKSVLRYASTATHVENMLTAMQNGLSYPLEITGFFVRATGRSAKSLARVTISLSTNPESKEIYQGWWVGSNTILGILKSLADAIRKWLFDKSIDSSAYYIGCLELAELDEKLSDGRILLHERAPYQKESHISRDYIEKILVARLGTLEKNHKSDEANSSKEELKRYKENLESKINEAKLMQLYIALLEGDLPKAGSLLENAHRTLEIAKSSIEKPALTIIEINAQILSLYASSCLMLYNFLIGDKEFLVGKLWRHRGKYRLDIRLKNLEKYANSVGAIDLRMYLYASQIYGVNGQLEFYSDSKDGLRGAIINLIDAAHYASRIGHIRRAAYWIAYVSRIYCRLGEYDKAKKFLSISKKVLDSQNFLQESSKEENWAMSNILLAEGETYLQTGNESEALYHFFHALSIAVSTRFTRLAADSFYNIYRAARGKEIESGVVNRVKTLFIDLDEHSEVWSKDEMTKEFRDFIHRFVFNKISLPELLQESKANARRIWNRWASCAGDFKDESDTHLIEDEMESDKFLV